MSDTSPLYFGTTLLGLGRYFNALQIMGYFIRTGLVAIGLIVVELLIVFGLNVAELINAVNIFTGKIISTPGSLAPFLGIVGGYYIVHYIPCFMMGYKKFRQQLDGDKVARDLFENVNHVIIREESHEKT